MTLLAHRIELRPSRMAVRYFRRAAGVARFAYNWALARWKEHYAKGEKTSGFSLQKELNGIKAKEFPWMMEVSKCASAQARRTMTGTITRPRT